MHCEKLEYWVGKVPKDLSEDGSKYQSLYHHGSNKEHNVVGAKQTQEGLVKSFLATRPQSKVLIHV